MDAPETGLTRVGERIQEALEAETQAAQELRAVRVRLLEHVTQGRGLARRAAARRLRAAAFAASAAVLIAGALALAHSWSQPISFVAGASAGSAGDVLQAEEREPLRISFSEGSEMLLHEGSRARVLDTRAAGARVLLEGGSADVSIVPRTLRGARWRFEAGPFQVLVKGTQFELGWDAAAQELSLAMKEGRVEVSGPCLQAPRLLERGASLRMSCAKPVPPSRRAEAPEAEPARAPESSSQPGAAHEPEQREPRSALRRFAASCETASKAELVAWANRERLAGSVARARTALLALRRRFPGSNEAATGAFALGRMAFDQRGDYREAARWFAVYLAEQPSGPLMGDAAGRLLEAHERQGKRAAARRDAEAYLGRFPDGPYAPLAKRILAE